MKGTIDGNKLTVAIDDASSLRGHWVRVRYQAKLNKDVIDELVNEFGGKIYDEALTQEHSIEIQLPIIQSIFKDIKIIPVLVGRENPQKITDIIEKY